MFVLTVFGVFFVCENVIPRLYFGSVVFFLDITRWSVTSPVELRVMYTDKSFESAEIASFKLVNFVLGFRPKWSSKGVFCSSEWVVNLSTCSALSRLFLRLVRPLNWLLVDSSWIGWFSRPIPFQYVDLLYRICR